jgi:DNA polymerase
MPELFEAEAIDELFAWIDEGGLIEAHNAFFERAIWTNILSTKYGWPAIPATSWRCSAAKAASHALPRKLEDAGSALYLDVTKDTEGHKVMLKVSKPRKARKKEREEWLTNHATLDDMPLLWQESSDLFNRLFAYCRQDVLAEEELSSSLPDLSPSESRIYVLDQVVNERGFQLDLPAVQKALELISTETAALNGELGVITQGSVTRATQRDRMKRWLGTQGVTLYDTKGATIDDVLAEDDGDEPDDTDSTPWDLPPLPPAPRRALEILRTLGRSSTAKYETMLNWACGDGRVRGGLLYHGASTGRWSGAGVQPHNFPKGTIKGFDMEVAWEKLKRGENPYPSYTLMENLACALRGAIIARPGHQLYVADFAGIEARGLLWFAQDERGLDIFRSNGDPYCDMASAIYDREITKADKNERQLGKAAVLGCGYQMGGSKFQATALTYGVEIDEEFATEVVRKYREKYWKVKNLWWSTEAAAIEAMSKRGVSVKNNSCSWLRSTTHDFLYCILPSGRRLAYPEPEVRERETPWGAMKPSLTFKGVDARTRQWRRQVTYGGSLVENIVQALSRDLMAGALERCEEHPVYIPVLSVHDELVAEAPMGTGDVKEFEALTAVVPKWAAGMPIAAEGWRGMRYRK